MKNILILLFASLTLTSTLLARAQVAGQNVEEEDATKQNLSFQSGDTPSKSTVLLFSNQDGNTRIQVKTETSSEASDCCAAITGKKEKDKEDYSFIFEGKKFKDLNQLDREIRYEEYLLRRKGYFKFMNQWYEPLDSIDNIRSEDV